MNGAQKPTQAEMKAAVQAYVDQTNAGNATGIVALFAHDAVIEDPVGSPPKASAEITAWFCDSVAFDAKIYPIGPIRGSHACEAALAFDVEFAPPDSPRLRIRSVDVFSFNAEGKIAHLKAYWGQDDIGLAEEAR